MKALKTLLVVLLSFCGSILLQSKAQTTQPFVGRIYNKEYKVFINMNAIEQNIVIPGQELFGEMAGYLKSDDDSRCWLMVSLKMSADGKTATITFSNDYGSEDLESSLTLNENGTYTLRQLNGSTLKIARNKKWVKLPKTLEFK